MSASARMTLEEFAGRRAGNYCTLPTLDVDIMGPVHHCQTCGLEVWWDRSSGLFGSWFHVEEVVGEGHYVNPRNSCRYCHTDVAAEVAFTFQAYSDETRCARCGGISGFAIGD